MRCDKADPKRCQAVQAQGQCNNLSLEGANFCEIHGKVSKAELQERRLRHYLLSNPDLQARLNRQAEVEEVRSLREEIHITRMMIETRLDLIEDNDRGDMLAAFSSVNTYLQTLDKLVNSCHKMEVSLDHLLGKGSILTLGREIANILVDELQNVDGHEEIVDHISERIIVAIAEQQNKEK